MAEFIDEETPEEEADELEPSGADEDEADAEEQDPEKAEKKKRRKKKALIVIGSILGVLILVYVALLYILTAISCLIPGLTGLIFPCRASARWKSIWNSR